MTELFCFFSNIKHQEQSLARKNVGGFYYVNNYPMTKDFLINLTFQSNFVPLDPTSTEHYMMLNHFLILSSSVVFKILQYLIWQSIKSWGFIYCETCNSKASESLTVYKFFCTGCKKHSTKSICKRIKNLILCPSCKQWKLSRASIHSASSLSRLNFTGALDIIWKKSLLNKP